MVLKVYEDSRNFPSHDRSNPSSRPLGDVSIYFGFEKGFYLFCRTSSEGRCGVSAGEKVGRLVTVVLIKDGYLSQSHKIQISRTGELSFTLSRGKSLDVLALASHFGSPIGLENMIVKSQKQVLGKTGYFGYFSIPMSQLPSSQITVSSPLTTPFKRRVALKKKWF